MILNSKAFYAIALTTAALFLSSQAGRTQVLVNIDLGDLTSVGVSAGGLNDSGQVVGPASNDMGGGDAFLYSNGTVTDLGLGSAYKINNAGLVVGTGTTGPYVYANGIKSPLTGMTNAFGINNSGQIIGVNGQTAVLYSDGITTPISGLAGAAFSTAFGTNDNGQIVGSSLINLHPEAFSLLGGITTDLGTGSAFAVNSAGQIVGSAVGSADGGSLLYTAGHRIILTTSGEAEDINDKGQVVGFTVNSTGTESAYVYSTTTGVQDLNSLYSSMLVSGTTAQAGFTSLVTANDINQSGEILGLGYYWNGTENVNELFLIVPEPNTAVLLLGGFVLLLCWRGRATYLQRK